MVQIKHQFREMYRYLIFKDSRSVNPKFLGKIDVSTKYRPADPVVVMSNDRAWLIVQSTVPQVAALLPGGTGVRGI